MAAILIFPHQTGLAHCHEHSGWEEQELTFMNCLLCARCYQTPCQC